MILSWQVSNHVSGRRNHVQYLVILGKSNKYNPFSFALFQGLLLCFLQVASRRPNHPASQQCKIRFHGANLDVESTIGRSRSTKILSHSLSLYKKDSRQELEIGSSSTGWTLTGFAFMKHRKLDQTDLVQRVGCTQKCCSSSDL